MYADENAERIFKKPYGFYGLQPHLPLKSVAKMPLQASIFARIVLYENICAVSKNVCGGKSNDLCS